MSEPELTPQILVGVFASEGKPEIEAAPTEQTGEQGRETSIEQPQGSRDELTGDQIELATRYVISAQEVRRVRGRTWAERCEDAERPAAVLARQPNRGERLALAAGKAHQERIVELFHGPVPGSGDEHS